MATPDLMLATASYYRQRYLSFGDSAQGMDWKDAASQQLRFARLLRPLDLGAGRRLLDVGCGNGELLAYCHAQGLEVDYLGIDLCEEMVAACRRRHGEASAVVASTRELTQLAGEFDHVVASGTFNVKQEAPVQLWQAYFEDSVAAMVSRCRLGVAFNVISTQVDFQRPHLFHLDPARVPELAARCGTRRYLIDHSYPLWELTVALWRP